MELLLFLGFLMVSDPVILIVVLLILFLLVAVVGLVLVRRRRTAQPKPSSPKKSAKSSVEKSAAGEKPAVEATAVTPAASTAKKAATTPASSISAVKADGEEKIRILIVDDNPDTRENVGRLLYFEKDLEVIGQAVNGRQGIEMAIKFKPHIVLMDINMPDMDGITATREMGVVVPFSQVIIMSVQAEQHYMKQAMAAGARDFQPKPFTADELVNCIKRVYRIGQPIYRQLETSEQSAGQFITPTQTDAVPSEGAPVIAVYSPKGGIGVSTIAANLAVALQQEYGDVVLMDADLQFGDILVHLNTKATRTTSDLVHNGELDVELVPEIVLAHNSGLKLLLGPTRPELADSITPDMVGEIVKSLRKHFKLVVIDTASQLSDKTLVVLDNSDYILLVTAPELPAIKNAKLFLELTEQLEFAPEKVGVLINRANVPGGVQSDKIEKALKISHSYRIPYDLRLHVAINKGLAIGQQDAAAPSAQAITYLARELGKKLVESKPAVTEVA